MVVIGVRRSSYGRDRTAGRVRCSEEPTIVPLLGRGKTPLPFGLLLREIDGGLSAAGYLQFLENIFEIVTDGFIAQLQ